MFGFRVGPVAVELDAPQRVAGGPVVADLAADHAAPLLLHVGCGVDQHLVLIGAVGGPVHAAAVDADIAARNQSAAQTLTGARYFTAMSAALAEPVTTMTAAAARTIFFMWIPCPRSAPGPPSPAP